MTDEGRKMQMAESSFLAGVEENFQKAKGKQFQGSIWRDARFDQSDRLRALMAGHRVYDRRRLKELPHNRTVALYGYRRSWWFRKLPTGVALASVLCPLDDLVDPDADDAPPIGSAELFDHVRNLVTDPSVPHAIGVCAPSGFTPEALSTRLDLPNVTLVLIEPNGSGGWNVVGNTDELPENVLAIFDPERDDDKIERVREEIERRSADLLVGGLSASSIAEKLGVPRAVASAALERVADNDPELRITREANELLLFRGAAGPKEATSMNVVDRIRQLFAREGDEAEKINVLAERRAKLAERRDRLYEDISKLEGKEADLLKQGRQTQSTVVRRRLAGQLDQLRKDINRENTTANMLSKQIDIISTDIHNLTLIQQGNMAKLPSTEELTENAVQAEEMLETLAADADLVSSLETGLSETSMSESEISILAEFEEAEQSPPAEDRVADTTPDAKLDAAPRTADAPQSQSTRDVTPPDRQADPEAS